MSTVHVTFWDPVTASSIGDAEVTLTPQTPAGAISAALPAPYRGAELHLGAQAIPADTPFGRSPISSGAYLSAGAPGPAPALPAEAAGVLRVVDGPDAGQVFPLAPGLHDIARRAEASVTLTDQEVTRRGHTRLTVGGAGPGAGTVTVEDLGSANGTWIGDERVPPQVGAMAGPSVPLAPGARLRVGTTVMAWSPAPAERRTATRSPDGALLFDRSFGAVPLVSPLRLQLPVTNETPRSAWSLLVPLLLPVVAGVVMAVLAHQPLFLVFAVLGPISALASHLIDRAQRRRREADLLRRRAEVADAVRQQIGTEAILRNEHSPGPAEALMAATGMSDRLWPRDAADADALLLRTGRATQPAAVTLDGQTWPGLGPPVVPDAPLTVDLRTAGVLGVTGPRAQTAELTRWLIVQLATLRSPSDLRLVVLSSADDADDAELGWTRWLPHLLAGELAPFPARTGTTPATRLRRIAELEELITQRRTTRAAAGASAGRYMAGWHGDVVVVLDGALDLRSAPGMNEVLRDGPSVGVYSIAADTGSMNESGAQCRFGPDGALHVTRSRSEPSVVAEPDHCPRPVAELIARSIAPLRDRLSPSSDAAPIPHPVRFLDLLGIPGAPSADDVRARWTGNAQPVTRVPIGADAEGPVLIDLAEQGPHAMLGGATGAGKSYLLQALVTSLLMANAPDRLNLVLVDFKGGSAFLPFQHCPHVVALIRSTGATPADVFDDAAARRLLASVRAEVQRRESVLAPFGGEIDEYWHARSTQPGLPALPRLVFVLDEFARVLETAPDFPRELVNVAAKGRALGMHLVLATQSLQGKLSPELKNAIDLRITLRQNEPADSTEVLGSPAAAAIPARLRGRGLILCTRDDARVPRPFQSGFLGAPPPAAGVALARVLPLPWADLGMDRPLDPPAEAAEGPADQELCIAAIEAAGAGQEAPFRPVLPPLPAVLSRGQLTRTATGPAVTPSTVVFALADDPAHQTRPLVGLDLSGTERLMVAGGPQQGRTTFARTLIDGLTQQFGPGQVNLYLVERAPGGLAAFERLAHCGGVITAAEPDRLRRLAQWLGAEEARRRSLPGAGWQHEPKVVVIVDGWELIENRSDPAYLETSVAATMRDVAASAVTAGIHVVAIGGLDMLNGKLPARFDRRLILAFPAAESRQQHLPPGTAPAPALPGRAIDASTGRPVQFAVPARTDEEIIRASREVTTGRLPVAIPALPERVSLADLKAAAEPGRWIPIGATGHPPGTAGLDLFGGGPSTLLISGPRRSGRTTALRTVLHGLQELAVPVVLVATAGSPLRELPPIEGRLEVLTGTTLTDDVLRAAARRLGTTEYAVLVDDCHDLTLEPSTQGYAEHPTLIAELCGPTGPGEGRRALVLAGDASLVLGGQRRSLARPVQELVLGGHRLLLTPARAVGAREHGFTLEADQFFTGPPGRGYLGSGHDVTLLQVAEP